MDQAEASGKTVADALRAALAKLGATKEQVEMTVLDEGKRGLLFGRGGRDAVVRVELLPGEKPAAPSEGRGRGGRGRGRGRDGGPARDSGPREGGGERGRGRRGGSGGPGGGRGRQERGGRGGRSDDGFVETASPKLTEADFLGTGGSSAESSSSGGESGGRRGSRGGGGGESRGRTGGAPRRSEGRSERPRRDQEDEPVIEPNIDAEEVDFAATIVDDLLRILDIDAEISLREPVTPGDGLGSALAVIDISGDDLGVLIGRRGETLLNLQYLVNLMLGQRFPGKGGVTVDAEHYRHRREEEIVAKALRMAESVREYGDAITLEPMTAADRRLVHLALADDETVTTESTGEGENRKVVILPRN